jgi:hypothetical protein
MGRRGYPLLLASGETADWVVPLVDRQHPHDLFMQLAAIWRMPLTESTGFTIAGGPAAEPALGPVAFMHRASAADNPTAPLGHHTFDSTHIAFGVVTAAMDRGRFVVEGSLFNGREPDENRWDIEFGRLDSFSGRVWYRPNPEWELQLSSGRLHDPEELEPGDVVRSTVSAAWTRTSGASLSAVTTAYGRNRTHHGDRGALLVEGAHHANRNWMYTRFEAVQVESSLLRNERFGTGPADLTDPVLALTLGAVRDVVSWRGFEGGIGADVSVYRVPDGLQPSYSAHPASFHLFLRVRPPVGSMGRMWNMRMSQPMAGHAAGMPMNHQMP